MSWRRLKFGMRGGRLLPALVVGFLAALLATVTARCEPPLDGALLDEQLAAGEFAPALAGAEQVGDAAERDRWLASIALAQARAGSRSDSLRTAAGIDNDSARQQTLGEVGSAQGGQGGAQAADFESLIELITTTIAPTSWEEVGGPGAIQEFEGGVRVDALGTMRPAVKEDGSGRLADIRRLARRGDAVGDVRQTSALRKVSLPRLERAIEVCLAAGRPLTEEMLTLAGLERVRYVLLYPETGDLVLVGPAGDWTRDAEGRLVRSDSGQPVLRLDDLVLLLRHFRTSADGTFGCSITPRKEGLAEAQNFLNASAKAPLKPGKRDQWLAGLRKAMGTQQLEVFGIDPRSRTAHVLLEADYRMKLVGIGLEEGTLDVPSYLDLVHVPAGQAPPALGVLRWWFTMNYDALLASPDRDGFELRGQGVKVLSENEMLTAAGQRIHTGKSDEPTSEFADRFTKHFDGLAVKYPVYAELRNIFDLALVASLLRTEGLADRIEWNMPCFGDPDRLVLGSGPVPQNVETVANYRIVNKRYVLAAASGGVRVSPQSLVKRDAIAIDRQGDLGSERKRSAPREMERLEWWWD